MFEALIVSIYGTVTDWRMRLDVSTLTPKASSVLSVLRVRSAVTL